MFWSLKELLIGSLALWYQWTMCLYISVIAENKICWHLFKIVLLELKKNTLWNVALSWYHLIRKVEWLYAWAIWSCISLMKFVCECASAHDLSFHSRTLFIMKRNILSPSFNSYWWGSSCNGRLFLKWFLQCCLFPECGCSILCRPLFLLQGELERCCYFITASG